LFVSIFIGKALSRKRVLYRENVCERGCERTPICLPVLLPASILPLPTTTAAVSTTAAAPRLFRPGFIDG
jgi:hypothetical protein